MVAEPEQPAASAMLSALETRSPSLATLVVYYLPSVESLLPPLSDLSLHKRVQLPPIPEVPSPMEWSRELYNESCWRL